LADQEIEFVTAEDYTTSAYQEYGMYTLEERAIPALQDGLLPVQRRILYSMWNLGLRTDSKFAKCANIVGHTMGKYHPHGDQGIYGALVNMTNPEMSIFGGDPRAPVFPQGNFGIPRPGEGKPTRYPAAAMRYTEAKLSKLGTALFDCLDVAKMDDNFDGSTQEPWIIPCRVPLLLMQGSYGVALGANTIIPPHHPVEVLRAARLLLDDPEVSVRKLMTKVKGPDYGFARCLSSREDIAEVYTAGKGTLHFLCDYHIERGSDCHELVVTSLAPGFLLAQFLKVCRQLENESKIVACNDCTDASGTRLIIQFKDPVVVEERILPRLRTRVSYQWNVIDKTSDGRSQFARINLKEYLAAWVDYRRQVEEDVLRLMRKKKIEQFRRETARLAGIQNIDELAKILANPKLSEEESNKLIIEKVKIRMGSKVKDLDQEQVQMLLDLKIRSLRALNLKTQEGKVKAISKEIREIQAHLKDVDGWLRLQLEQAEKIFPKGYKRGMKLLNGTEPELEMPEGEAAIGFWNITDKGFVRDFKDLPQRKGKWYADSVTVPATANVTIVESSGKAHTYQSVYLTRGSLGLKSPVVGSTSDRFSHLMVVDADGFVGVIENPPIKNHSVVMKTEKELVLARGVNLDDEIFVTNGKTWAAKKVSDIGSKRPNSKGTRFFRGKGDLHFFVIPRGGTLVMNGHGPIADRDLAAKSPSQIFPLAPKGNWVVDQNNIKAVMTAGEASAIAQETGILSVDRLR